MVEDNQPWSQDRFGNHVTTNRYDKMRDTTNYDPVENETLSGYIERLAKWIQQAEEINTGAHIYGRKMWYTHKNPTSCFLCDDITIHWKLYESLKQVSKHLPYDPTCHWNGSMQEWIQPNTP